MGKRRWTDDQLREAVASARCLADIMRALGIKQQRTIVARAKDLGLDIPVGKERCSECGLTEWRGQPIPLELDHISGNRRDLRVENLRLLCPNCHALTPTYRGKNATRERRGLRMA